jgi:hypothetical protein
VFTNTYKENVFLCSRRCEKDIERYIYSGSKSDRRCCKKITALKVHNMFKEIDYLDQLLIQGINENPYMCICEVIQPFFTERAESTLCARIRALARLGLISLQREKHVTRCSPVVSTIKSRASAPLLNKL